MPTRVRSHIARRGRTRYRVRSYVRYGPEHTAKWKRLVSELRRKGGVASPEAVATKVLGRKGTFTKRGRKEIVR